MDKFQTNAVGNIDSGTEVLANNLTFLQNGTEKLFTDFFGNTFTTGIVNTNDGNSMFPLTANADGTFNVGMGTAYVFDPATELYKRIEINIGNMIEYNPANPTQTTDDGTGVLVLTPKSTGCLNIPIENANVIYWVDLQYLQICDNGNEGDGLGLKNYSIAKKINPSEDDKKRFYQWIDGYKIVLQTGGKQNVVGVCLGTVMKDSNDNITFSYEDKADHLLIKSNAFLEWLISGEGLIIKTDPETNKPIISVDVNSFTSLSFSINGGPSTGTYLSWGGQQVQLIASVAEPLILHPANSERYSVNGNDIDPINVQLAVQEIEGTSVNINGVYTLFINDRDKTTNVKLEKPKFEIIKDIVVSKQQLSTTLFNNDTVWLDISKQPYQAYYCSNFQWLPYYGVPVAYIKISNTSLATNGVAMFNYNKDYSKWDELGRIEARPQICRNTLDGYENPYGYLLADGSEISTLDYYDYYISRRRYDYTDTETVIALPDMLGRTFWGGLTITTLEAGLPDHTHNVIINNDQTAAGTTYDKLIPGQSGASHGTATFESTGVIDSNIYSDDVTTVQPPALQYPMFIKVLL